MDTFNEIMNAIMWYSIPVLSLGGAIAFTIWDTINELKSKKH